MTFRNSRELASVLAGLRMLQNHILGSNPDNLDFDDIRTDAGSLKPLTIDEIDGLCMRLNCGRRSDSLPPWMRREGKRRTK